MPARNGTGPLGQGPLTGWGRGFCRFPQQQVPSQEQQLSAEEGEMNPQNPQNPQNAQGAVYNPPQNGAFPFPFFGRGRGFFCRGMGGGGFGCGRGRGRGGFGRFGG